jgi:YegS/Rv2252/BmrU family lipid kinase
MHLAIIANPIAGGGRLYRKILRYIDRWDHPNWTVELLPTQHANHAGVLALQLMERPPDLLAVFGGDGTINEVATSLPNPPFPIAVLPGGTANVLARELGLPLDPIPSLKVALNMNVLRADLGELEGECRRRFTFVAGIGFDAYAVYKARPSLKAKIGMAAYGVAIIECLRNYSFPEFQVVLNGRSLAATSCLVCNAKSYGGGMVFCPDANMADGFLDVLIIEGVHRAGLARFLLSAWCGIQEKPSWVHRMRTKELSIEGPSSVMVETDGELAGTLPVRIHLSPNSFPLVVP